MWKRLGITLEEPSTWFGIITLLSLFGVTLDPEQTDAIIKAGVAIAGALGLFFKWDTKPKTETVSAKTEPDVIETVNNTTTLEELVKQSRENQ